jgi:hypothetical protein
MLMGLIDATDKLFIILVPLHMEICAISWALTGRIKGREAGEAS